MYDFIDQIMKFRTAYLRAVARASVDLAFREDLTNPHNHPLKILREECGYNGTWDLTLVLHDDPDKGRAWIQLLAPLCRRRGCPAKRRSPSSSRRSRISPPRS
jgi:hypothetical protein